jgi:hypothetical protein
MDKRLFVAKVVGHSTEDGIPDGSWGLFRLFTAGAVLAATALDGKRVIVQLRDQADPETGGRYTLKRWRVALAPVLEWNRRYALLRLRAAFFGFTARSLITSRSASTVLSVSGNSRAMSSGKSRTFCVAFAHH